METSGRNSAQRAWIKSAPAIPRTGRRYTCHRATPAGFASHPPKTARPHARRCVGPKHRICSGTSAHIDPVLACLLPPRHVVTDCPAQLLDPRKAPPAHTGSAIRVDATKILSRRELAAVLAELQGSACEAVFVEECGRRVDLSSRNRRLICGFQQLNLASAAVLGE